MELLAAIAVLAVLLALLYSGAASARAHAANTRCTQNLRTLAVGALRFMQERGGTLLPSKHFTNPSWRADKPGFRDYVGIESANSKINAPEFLVDSAFTCPAVKQRYPTLFPSYLNRAYVANYYAHLDEPENLDELPADRAPASPHFFGRLGNLPSPARTWLFADGCIRKGPSLPTYMKPTFTTTDYDLGIHQGRQNTVFFDGHIEALTREDFTGRSRRFFWGIASAVE